MRGEDNSKRARLKGYLLEAVITKFLSVNGFKEINHKVPDRIRMQRDGFVEFRGRGGWHQIDCPFDYGNYIPFINPVRVLAEVKFHSKPIQKNIIRELIGTIKDIHENYFVSDINESRKHRYTELGAIFSASGFSDEAEMLAFAHNIKTISYNNVALMNGITEQLKEMERNFFSIRYCSTKTFIKKFKKLLFDFDSRSVNSFIGEFHIPEGFNNSLEGLFGALRRIRSNFIAHTEGGAIIHFIGEHDFPNYLFRNTDNQQVRVYYSEFLNGEKEFWMTFSEDLERRRFYFNPPESLREAAFYGGLAVLNEKERQFRKLHFTTTINGISRNLELNLDRDWLDPLRESRG